MSLSPSHVKLPYIYKYILLYIIELHIYITALASATGEKDTPGRTPPDSIEQGAKPPDR